MKKVSQVVLMALALVACKEDTNKHAKVSADEKVKIEACIDEICKKIFCAGSCANDSDFAGLGVIGKDGFVTLTAEQAIKISPKWDYNNPKFYQNNADGILFDYEKDACETLERLNRFIAEII
jgi:hypothetical protein